jgi:WD40 repeat protein
MSAADDTFWDSPEQRLARLWREGAGPDLRDFLNETGPLSPRQLTELLLIDQRERWRRGERIFAERYLRDYPAVAADAEAVLDIICGEYFVRDELGEVPDSAEYARRFPANADKVKLHIDLHRALFSLDTSALGESTEWQNQQDAPAEPAVTVPPLGLEGYQILGLLGRGGMGVVYKARQLSLNRLVALKMLRGGMTARPQEIDRFRAEATALARLQHPNIVQIYEVGAYQGEPYLSLEYVDGGNLSQKIASTPQPPTQAAELLRTLALTVQAAHDNGIIHRDLKPDNVLLTADGTPKITDFGLAKHLTLSHHKTCTGTILGTPSYMAPEQAAGRGRESGPATDVYGLGALLYTLLTGRPPFHAETPVETLNQVMNEEPLPPSRSQAKLPLDIETICLKCLQKDPAHRYGSARELAEELRRFLHHEPIRARPVGPWIAFIRWCRRNPALARASGLALVGLLLALVLAVSFGLYQQRAAADLQQALREADRVSANLAFDRGLALCEQGEVGQGLLWFARSLAMAEKAEDADLQRVCRVNLADWQEQIHPLRALLEHEQQVNTVAASPDGRLAATGSNDRTARLWNVETGTALGAPLQHEQAVHLALFRPDSQALLTVAGRDAFLWSSVDGRSLGVSVHHGAKIRAAAFRPDGGAVLTTGEDGQARLWDARTGAPLGAVMRHRGPITAVAFSPDGQHVLTGSEDTTACLWHVASGKCAVGPLQHTQAVRAVAVSPDGRQLLTGGADAAAHLWDAATGQPRGQAMRHRLAVQAVAFSPDGRTIATGSRDWRARLWHSATGEPCGEEPDHQGHGPVACLAFSPDSQLLLSGSQAGHAHLWDTASGTRVFEPLTQPGELLAIAFSGHRHVLTAGQNAAVRLWQVARLPQHPPPLEHTGWLNSGAIRADGKVAALASDDGVVLLLDPVTRRPHAPAIKQPEPVRGVALSADGRLLATANTDCSARLWDVATGRLLATLQPHTHEVTCVAFRPDGRALATGTIDGSISIWSVEPAQQQAHVAAHSGGPVWALAFSPDGALLASAGADHSARLWQADTLAPASPSLPHQGQVFGVAFSPDGREVLTASEDKKAQFWDVATGRGIGASIQSRFRLSTVAFSPDGGTVLLGTAKTASHCWDRVTRKPLGRPLPHEDQVLAGQIVPGSKDVLWIAQDKVVRCQKLPPPLPGSVEQVRLWAQVVTGQQLDASGTVWGLDRAAWQQQRDQLRGSELLP